MRFLAVNVPYHSHYLESTSKTLRGPPELSTSEELITLAIFHTKIGYHEV
ncbi:hypothetical protein M407DRAFT_28269 [Tulasnella calospora MUT 4182]|uniref:Uncharacterized protein n=1 Tax=Tulasnella calospora MUT 4182 TaxID=1051891 RepID=A0A0C3QCB5_9AGAM|nr:hypothetical protein M407DRAFT_28269 [Tulasnella calospora MUT 4182]